MKITRDGVAKGVALASIGLGAIACAPNVPVTNANQGKVGIERYLNGDIALGVPLKDIENAYATVDGGVNQLVNLDNAGITSNQVEVMLRDGFRDPELTEPLLTLAKEIDKRGNNNGLYADTSREQIELAINALVYGQGGVPLTNPSRVAAADFQSQNGDSSIQLASLGGETPQVDTTQYLLGSASPIALASGVSTLPYGASVRLGNLLSNFVDRNPKNPYATSLSELQDQGVISIGGDGGNGPGGGTNGGNNGGPAGPGEGGQT